MKPETIRILMIDDEQGDFLVTKGILSQIDVWEISLDWAPTFADGKVAIETGEHDLYLLDYVLDERTGLDMLGELGRFGLRSPVIMLTGKGNFSVDVEAMQLGVADYLSKQDLNPELVERSIRYALDRHKSQRALKESEERLRGMFDHLPVGLFRCTSHGGFIDANPTLIRLLGYPGPESLERYAEGFYVGPSDRSHFLAALDRMGVVQGFETQLEGRDGRILKLRTTARVHRDASGEVVYVEGAVEDVTDAWPTVGFYMDATRFQQMFKSGPFGMIIFGIDGAVQNANPVFLRAGGYEVGELIETPFLDLWCDEDQDLVRRDVATLGLEQDESAAERRRFRHRCGDLLEAEVSMTLIRDWDGNPHHVLVMMETIAAPQHFLP
jgi:PAS domain S-box-containing protein